MQRIDEKHLNLEVKLMLWNPKMDLIAIGYFNGDVHLFRLSWQKVWSVPSPQQNISIASMAWRPDGKILAVAYTNGHLRLHGVEDAKKIYAYNCSENIVCLNWLQEDPKITAKHELNNFYEDLSTKLLPKPINYDILYHLFEKSNNRDFPDNLFINDAKSLTYLLCTHGTSMAIFVYGYFLIADTNFDSLPNNFSSYKQLRACYLSDNCALMSTLGFVDDNEQQNDATQSCTMSLMYSLIDASILSENHVQIKLISAKFGLLFSMLTALKTVIKEMEELWEDILVEMDQKFQIYALEKYNRTSVASGNNDESGVSAKPGTSSSDALVTSSLVHDFIQLYAIGSCSDHFKTFLIHELTEKGLKKLEASVENYYSNIQRLLCGNFHQITLCIFYHLNELHGMTKWTDKFKIFSLTEQRVEDVLNNCGSLILKAQELNFVVDQNMKEIKLFFKWLHSSIIHLTDDQAVTEMLNEEMENSILNFINNTFKDDQTINLEKVGQYLKSENLRILVNEDNEWQQFVRHNLDQKDQQHLYAIKREKSLIGCFEDFKQSLNVCFKCQAISNTQPFRLLKQYLIHKPQIKDSNELLTVSHKCFGDTMVTGLLMEKSNTEAYVLKHCTNIDAEPKLFIISLLMPDTDLARLSLQDVYVYNENSLTILGFDNKGHSSNTHMIQLNFDNNDSIMDENVHERIKVDRLLDDKSCLVKQVANTRTAMLCVSRTRKVAALLSISRRRVRLFYLENEENDDDEDNENDQENDTGNENVSMKNEEQVPLANIENNEQTIQRINKRKKNFDEDEDDEQQQVQPGVIANTVEISFENDQMDT